MSKMELLVELKCRVLIQTANCITKGRGVNGLIIIGIDMIDCTDYNKSISLD